MITCAKCHVDILKMTSFAIQRVNKVTFYPIPGDFTIFRFSVSSNFNRSKSFRVISSVLYGNMTTKHILCHPNPKFTLRPFDFVTSDEFDLKRGYQRLKTVLRSSLDTIFVISLTSFQLDTAILHG